MIDGINGNYYGVSATYVSGNENEIPEEDSTINFTEENAEVEENGNDGVDISGCPEDETGEIQKEPESDEDVDKRNFDLEEAHVYAEGEAEIEKEVKLRMLLQTGVKGLLFGKTQEEIEAEVRAEYAKEHPEYAAVMEEGQAVEKAHAEAKAKAMADWEANNPRPEQPVNIFGLPAKSVAYMLELQKWEAERAKQAEAFDESYAKDNSNYANLKEQEDSLSNVYDIIKTAKGPIIFGKD